MSQFLYYNKMINSAFKLIKKKFRRHYFEDKNENIDIMVEKFVVKNLRKKIKDFTLISEESEIINVGNSTKRTFFLDPIDGTGNVVRKIPIFAISFACSPFQTDRLNMDKIYYSIIISSLGLKFEAIKGKGFFINDQKVKKSVKENKKIDECFIRINPAEQFFSHIFSKHVRLLGASSIELGLLANRTFDAFIDFGTLKLTDIAAPYLILKEAQVAFSDLNGNSLNSIEMRKCKNLSLVAANSKILHRRIIEEFGKINK